MDLPAVLIPAYKPDLKMLRLINDLQEKGFFKIIVIDDGSGADYAAIFEAAAQAGCLIERHAINMGKGRALKTGINAALLQEKAGLGLITADADGQHTAEDIFAVATAMLAEPAALVLGVRQFSEKMPLLNKMGNTITRGVFALINGNSVKDTQTGLRGLPLVHLPLLLSLKGERYEYEMNMLLEARPHGISFVQVPISTIYIEGNKSSHYRSFIDSVRIYGLILLYIMSAIISTAVDFGIFAIMFFTFPSLLMLDVLTGRLISSVVNFFINKKIVFKQKGTVAHAAVRYYILVALVSLASFGLIKLLTSQLGMNVFIAKLVTDISLGLVSFFAQREFVYAPSAKARMFKKKSKDS